MVMKPQERWYLHGQRLDAPRGTVLYDYAQPWEGCYFLEQGCCALSVVTHTGEDRTLLYFQGTRPVGFMHIMGVVQASQTAIPVLITTKTPSVLYRLSAADLGALLEEDKDFSRYMNQVLAENFHQLLRRFHAVLDEDATQRLCRMLLEFAQEEGDTLVMPPYFTHVEMSRYLGLHTVTVSRIMAHLKELGYVTGTGRRIVLRDQPGLERLIAEGTNLDHQK